MSNLSETRCNIFSNYSKEPTLKDWTGVLETMRGGLASTNKLLKATMEEVQKLKNPIEASSIFRISQKKLLFFGLYITILIPIATDKLKFNPGEFLKISVKKCENRSFLTLEGWQRWLKSNSIVVNNFDTLLNIDAIFSSRVSAISI